MSLKAQIQNALNFDGTDDYVTVSSDLNNEFPNNQISLEAWIYLPTESPVFANIIGESELGDGTIKSVLYVAGDDITGGFFDVNVGPLAGSQISAPFKKGEWVHAAFTYDGTIQKLYINGILANSRDLEGRELPEGSEEWRIGRLWDIGLYMNGNIDEVRIWNTARTCDEINANMKNELTGTENGLIAYYNFNQGEANGNNSSETILTDKKGNFNGTLNNFTLNETVSNWVDASANGVSGNTPSIPAEIEVSGKKTGINSGDGTPSFSDSTNFGGTCADTSRIYYIRNIGELPLHILELGFTGDAAGSFSTSVSTPFIIESKDSIGVRVTFHFDSDHLGENSANFYIKSNDCDENYFDFAIAATANELPEVIATATPEIICNGQTTILTGSGATSYTWNHGVTDGVAFEPEGTETYTVVGTSAEGCTNEASVTVSVTTCTGINKEATGTFNVFPNPFVSSFSINSSTTGLDLKIYDAQGLMIIYKTISENDIVTLENKPNGLYKIVLSESGIPVYEQIIMKAE